MAIKQGYTNPQLYDYGGNLTKDWYVGFRMTCPSTYVRKAFQFRMGINFYHTKTERSNEASACLKILKEALRTGWNPFQQDITDFLKYGNNAKVSDYRMMSFNDALDFAFEKRKTSLAPKSASSYSGQKEFAKAAAIKIGIARMPVIDTERKHIKLLLEQMAKDRQYQYDKEGKGKQFTGNSYNKYRDTLRALFTELEEFEAVKYNPCHKISDRPEIKTNIHRHATEKEQDYIREHLPEDDPQLFIYLMYEYLSGLRPKEIFGLKVCDIDWFNKMFDVHATDGRSKTREARKVIIPNVLMKYIEGQKLELYDPNDYIFSTYLLPGSIRKKRDYATKRWNKIVKVRYGLNVTMYSFKGLGGEAKRNAGINTAAIAGQYGHNNINTTLIYLHGEKERMNKDIIENTPDF